MWAADLLALILGMFSFKMRIHCTLLNTAIVTVFTLVLVIVYFLMLLEMVVHGALILSTSRETTILANKLSVGINDIFEGHFGGHWLAGYLIKFKFF